MEPGPAVHVVVDAANVVGSRPDGWWRDRAGAARRLLEALGGWPGPVTVVLEGEARAAAPPGPLGQPPGPLERDGAQAAPGGTSAVVVHAPAGGDDALVSVVGELATSACDTAPGGAGPIHVVVVTADRELRDRVAARGAVVVGPGWLLSRLPPAPPTAAAPGSGSTGGHRARRR